MIDAWTQTSDRGSDNEEAIKLQRGVASATTRIESNKHNFMNKQPSNGSDNNLPEASGQDYTSSG